MKGEASKMLTSITVTGDNFNVAMEFLQNRYDNKRLILRNHIQGIVCYRPVSNENTREIGKLVDTIEEHRLSLRNMEQPVELQDPFFVYLSAEKLPSETLKFSEPSSKDKELQSYQEPRTKDFPGGTCSSLGVSSTKQQFIKYQKTISMQQNQGQRHLHTHVTTTNQQCECCEEEHRIFECGKFKVLGVKEQAQLIKIQGLCFNCLRPGHRAENCEGSSCHQCGQKHHKLLHREDANQVNNQVKKSFENSRKANAGEKEKVASGASSSNAEQTTIDQKITAALTHEDKTQEIFLQTAIVPVNIQGEIVYLRAILDSTSQNACN